MSSEITTAHHQLFPMPEGAADDWRPLTLDEVAEIKVFHRVGGRKMLIPGPFGPLDLPDDSALFAKLGGGSYEVVAYRTNGQVARRRSVDFPGAPIYAAALAHEPASSGPSSGPSVLANGQVVAAAIGGAVTLLTAWLAHSREIAAREEQGRREMMSMLVAGKNDDMSKELLKAFLLRPQTPPPPATPAPTVEEQLAAMERVQEMVKKIKTQGESPDWLKLVEMLGPTALQVLGPALLAHVGPPAAAVVADPPLIRVVPG